ncbi:MAG: NAD(P)/FAD-dependent oxidoreductase [Candidatus Pacebacteria bacterium]|nr:NAD(P)/FAD-dependent oxidoreductase [Candidatus Paceibacterota bacterium]
MSQQSKIWDVIIIGGGASGMMTGAISGSRSKSVLILEKNKDLGEKLKITGGGRCNITNAVFDTRLFLKNYSKAESFLHSPFSAFSAKDTFNYFESLGLPLVIQARNRAFPETEKAYDVYRVLKNELEKNKVIIKTNCEVKDVVNKDNLITEVVTNQGSFLGKSFVFSTGGVSHPETGSTGDGFRFLKKLGHTVIDPTPSVVPFQVSDKWVHSLAGVSLSFMKITFFLEDPSSPIGKKQFSKTGKILFTHFGLSGPLILNSASRVGSLLQAGRVKAFIDAYPDTDFKPLEEKIIKVFDNNKNKSFKNILKEIVPEGTNKGIEMLIDFIDKEEKVHSITKENRKKLVHLLKALPINITNLMGYDRAVVVDGGVSLSEIETKTMKSKLYQNLYIAGDLLNINRPSGGYGLQICWTTGYVIGISV